MDMARDSPAESRGWFINMLRKLDPGEALRMVHCSAPPPFLEGAGGCLLDLLRPLKSAPVHLASRSSNARFVHHACISLRCGREEQGQRTSLVWRCRWNSLAAVLGDPEFAPCYK